MQELQIIHSQIGPTSSSSPRAKGRSPPRGMKSVERSHQSRARKEKDYSFKMKIAPEASGWSKQFQTVSVINREIRRQNHKRMPLELTKRQYRQNLGSLFQIKEDGTVDDSMTDLFTMQTPHQGRYCNTQVEFDSLADNSMKEDQKESLYTFIGEGESQNNIEPEQMKTEMNKLLENSSFIPSMDSHQVATKSHFNFLQQTANMRNNITQFPQADDSKETFGDSFDSNGQRNNYFGYKSQKRGVTFQIEPIQKPAGGKTNLDVSAPPSFGKDQYPSVSLGSIKPLKTEGTERSDDDEIYRPKFMLEKLQEVDPQVVVKTIMRKRSQEMIIKSDHRPEEDKERAGGFGPLSALMKQFDLNIKQPIHNFNSLRKTVNATHQEINDGSSISAVLSQVRFDALGDPTGVNTTRAEKSKPLKSISKRNLGHNSTTIEISQRAMKRHLYDQIFSEVMKNTLSSRPRHISNPRSRRAKKSITIDQAEGDKDTLGIRISGKKHVTQAQATKEESITYIPDDGVNSPTTIQVPTSKQNSLDNKYRIMESNIHSLQSPAFRKGIRLEIEESEIKGKAGFNSSVNVSTKKKPQEYSNFKQDWFEAGAGSGVRKLESDAKSQAHLLQQAQTPEMKMKSNPDMSSVEKVKRSHDIEGSKNATSVVNSSKKIVDVFKESAFLSSSDRDAGDNKYMMPMLSNGGAPYFFQLKESDQPQPSQGLPSRPLKHQKPKALKSTKMNNDLFLDPSQKNLNRSDTKQTSMKTIISPTDTTKLRLRRDESSPEDNQKVKPLANPPQKFAIKVQKHRRDPLQMANPTLHLGVPKQGTLAVAKVMKDDRMVIMSSKMPPKDNTSSRVYYQNDPNQYKIVQYPHSNQKRAVSLVTKNLLSSADKRTKKEDETGEYSIQEQSKSFAQSPADLTFSLDKQFHELKQQYDHSQELPEITTPRNNQASPKQAEKSPPQVYQHLPQIQMKLVVVQDDEDDYQEDGMDMQASTHKRELSKGSTGSLRSQQLLAPQSSKREIYITKKINQATTSGVRINAKIKKGRLGTTARDHHNGFLAISGAMLSNSLASLSNEQLQAYSNRTQSFSLGKSELFETAKMHTSIGPWKRPANIGRVSEQRFETDNSEGGRPSVPNSRSIASVNRESIFTPRTIHVEGATLQHSKIEGDGSAGFSSRNYGINQLNFRRISTGTGKPGESAGRGDPLKTKIISDSKQFRTHARGSLENQEHLPNQPSPPFNTQVKEQERGPLSGGDDHRITENDSSSQQQEGMSSSKRKSRPRVSRLVMSRPTVSRQNQPVVSDPEINVGSKASADDDKRSQLYSTGHPNWTVRDAQYAFDPQDDDRRREAAMLSQNSDLDTENYLQVVGGAGKLVTQKNSESPPKQNSSKAQLKHALSRKNRELQNTSLVPSSKTISKQQKDSLLLNKQIQFFKGYPQNYGKPQLSGVIPIIWRRIGSTSPSRMPVVSTEEWAHNSINTDVLLSSGILRELNKQRILPNTYRGSSNVDKLQTLMESSSSSKVFQKE